MEFELNKCATVLYKQGRIVRSHNIFLDKETSRRNVDIGESCVEEKDVIDNDQMKTKLSIKKRKIVNTELNYKT